jgi:hypothetical protein
MGASATVVSANGEASFETWCKARDVYEANKGIRDDETMLALIIQAIGSTATIEPSIAVPALSDKVKADLWERNKRFLSSCGKYEKGGTGKDLQRANVLYNLGVDVNYADEDGWSALFHAAGEGNIEIVKWLTELEGITIDISDQDNCTPLWIACYNGRRDVASVLLRLGADETIQGKPEDQIVVTTPAMAARRNRQPGIADYVEAEAELRKIDPRRRQRELAREMSQDEFRASLRDHIGGEARVSAA